MTGQITIDGVNYDKEDLSENAIRYIEAIAYLDGRELELSQLFASLRIAKNTNINNLKSKIIKIKTGVEF